MHIVLRITQILRLKNTHALKTVTELTHIDTMLHYDAAYLNTKE